MIASKSTVSQDNSKNFKIRTTSGYSRRMNNPSEEVLESFTNTTIVNKALHKKRKPVAKGVITMKNVTKELKKKN